ncbi:MAG: DNA repair protein RadA [Bacteroidota bacterium]
MKSQTKYVCQSCGYESPRWVGRCPNCEGWNTLVEELSQKVSAKKVMVRTTAKAVPFNQIESLEDQRISTCISEFDRVLGGGVVIGSVVLLGGDPGIGKSTLMLQLSAQIKDKIILYVTGEESEKQIKLRAERLNLDIPDSLLILAETNLNVISDIIERSAPDILVVDSIQTIFRPEFESSAGSVGQVRESTAQLHRLAKSKSIAMFLIGHVTKEGIIAGPKVIEHMVDAVLQFEGERHYSFRVLRAIKNRFGSTNEIGIFEMRDAGLCEVKNPSELFLSERSSGFSGSTVVASIEGTRPLLIEVQALVTPANYGVPQRNTTGFDIRRLGLLLAVLEKRIGVNLGQFDVFVNIVGGIHIDEPAIDLGIAMSILSSKQDLSIDSQTVILGEIGLGGEVRTINQVEKRMQEASKLGFKRLILPKNNLKGIQRKSEIELVGVERIEDAVAMLLQ